MKTDNIYIDKDELHAEITKYYESDDKSISEGKGRKQMNNKLGGMLMDIARSLMNSNRFRNYPERDDFMNDVLLKLSEILHHRKFNLFGQRKHPVLEEVEIKGFKLPDVELEPDQKFCMLDSEDPHTLAVFTMSSGFTVDGEHFNTPKEISDVYDFEVTSNRINLLDYGESLTTKTGEQITKNNMYDEFGNIAFNQDSIKFKKCFSLVGDTNSSVTIDCCSTIKVDNNGKRFLVESPLFFDTKGDNISMQKSNAFGYLSRSATLEVIKDIKNYNRRNDTLDNYQQQEWIKFMAENPDSQPTKMDDDSYSEYNDDNIDD